METKLLQKLLIEVAEGEITPDEAAERLKVLPYEDMGFANLDTHRAHRTGRGEVVFGIGKTPEQVAAIMKRMSADTSPVIATKVGPEYYEVVSEVITEGLAYYEQARLLIYTNTADSCKLFGDLSDKLPDKSEKISVAAVRDDDFLRFVGGEKDKSTDNHRSLTEESCSVAIVCAGTADIPIAEEAAITAETYGASVERYYDVGVAGIHRFLDKVEDIRKAKAIIVVAGMEGALASVVGGIADVPVIAVPTSIGYGASMGGLAALLTMLNSCSLGVSVVNIDNGFGAGYLASMIAKGKE